MIDLIVRHKGLYDVYISHYVTQSSSRPLSSEAGEGTGEAGERGKEALAATLSSTFPSPLAGEGGSRPLSFLGARRMRGRFRESNRLRDWRNRPLIRPAPFASALPDLLDTPRLPCLDTRAPQAAATTRR